MKMERSTFLKSSSLERQFGTSEEFGRGAPYADFTRSEVEPFEARIQLRSAQVAELLS